MFVRSVAAAGLCEYFHHALKRGSLIGETSMRHAGLEKSLVAQFREHWLRKGVELIDVTQLCRVEISSHGWCEGFREPQENIYHIKVWYRDEIVAQVHGDRRFEVLDDDRYVLFFDDGFIIFRQLHTSHGKRKRE